MRFIVIILTNSEHLKFRCKYRLDNIRWYNEEIKINYPEDEHEKFIFLIKNYKLELKFLQRDYQDYGID